MKRFEQAVEAAFQAMHVNASRPSMEIARAALLAALPVLVDREAVARIVDHEGYWERMDSCNHALSTVQMSDDSRRALTAVRDDELRGTADSLAKADAIAAHIKGEGDA